MTKKNKTKDNKDILQTLSLASVIVLKSEKRRVLKEIEKLEKSLETLKAE